MPADRVTCPVCDRRVGLNRWGGLACHSGGPRRYGPPDRVCDGTGRRPDTITEDTHHA